MTYDATNLGVETRQAPHVSTVAQDDIDPNGVQLGSSTL
jgi:hypothetical protein